MIKFDRVLSDAELISATFKAEVEGTMGELRAVEQAALAKLAKQEPVMFARIYNGEIDWDEACVTEDDDGLLLDGLTHVNDDGDIEVEEGYAVIPLYTHPTPNRQASLDSSLTRSGQLDRALVKSLALQSGFKPKEDGELREYVYDFAGKVLGSCKGSVDSSGHAEPFTPKTPAEMREFIGGNFDSLQYSNPETEEPDEMDRYTLTIHDLLSAFSWCGHYGNHDHIPDTSKMVGSDHIPDIGQMIPEGYALVPIEPTEEMHLAARDWSVKMYGKAIGFEASHGCYKAMLAAAPQYTGEK